MTAATVLRKLHGRTAVGVPRWAMVAAYAAALTTLPSAIWRITAFVLDAPLVKRFDAPLPGHGPVLFEGMWYILALSLISEVLAFLALGLVCEWGEVWPRWIPGLRGRRVPPLAAVIPAGLGATALLIFPYALAMIASGRMVNGSPLTSFTEGWQSVAFWVAYLPLAAWGPLLAILTVHYHRRRRAARSSAAAGATRPK
ncbi:hypothetical protein I0C86_15180 [Plantactinospora sp. S1510]|uniref:Uncharacterized protein n=1 Tax=Plantactinospora alkalitolerans TaxID=2789879 RepID=A0ABS0GW35_9ACTN|nr:hypothetical protein [Plantactinospora alkalitolerans]MBF9130289.1 hypothetical protein [Plantactinospora alkalitolerans]